MITIILEKTLQHLIVSLSALLIALCISIPLALSLSRLKNKKLTGLVVRSISLLQTIPGLAMLAVVLVGLVTLRKWMPIPIMGYLPGVLTLSIYSISPILTNTYMGIHQASPQMIDVATGLGMTKKQILKMVQLPQSIPMVMAGVRIAGVWTIGMCTLASLIGSGGLGDLIFQGLRSLNPTLVLAGTVPAAFLAILFELLLGKVEKWLTVSEG